MHTNVQMLMILDKAKHNLSIAHNDDWRIFWYDQIKFWTKEVKKYASSM